MRIHERQHRYNLVYENLHNILKKQYDYYVNNNLHTCEMFGEKIYNLYKRVNLQLVLSYKCNANCDFCCEKFNHCKDINDSDYIDALSKIMQAYLKNNIYPTVTITGGEPLLCYQKLNRCFNILKQCNVIYGVNTNGLNIYNHLDMFRPHLNENFHINMSRHSINNNERLFNDEKINNNNLHQIDQEIKNYITVQAVMIDNETDNLDLIKKYMNHYIDKGFKSFSFRCQYNYNEKIFFNVLNQVFEDNNFEFKQQKIGDHYLFEHYNYKGCFVRFVFADLELLQEYERKEKENICRNSVLYPDGRFATSWFDKVVKQF